MAAFHFEYESREAATKRFNEVCRELGDRGFSSMLRWVGRPEEYARLCAEQAHLLEEYRIACEIDILRRESNDEFKSMELKRFMARSARLSPYLRDLVLAACNDTQSDPA
jgi:hypothetical protein